MSHYLRTRVKFIFLLAVCILAFAPIARAQETPVTLRVLGFKVAPEEVGTPLDKAYQSFLQSFQDKHKNVTIDSIETPPEFDTQVLVDLAAGTAPDVWPNDGSTLAKVVDTGSILDMRECMKVVPDLKLDRFFPSVLSIHQRPDGAVYGLPNDFTPMVMYYNPQAFKKANVTTPSSNWTWDEFLTTVQKLTLDSDGHNSLDPKFDKTKVVQWGFRVRKFVFEWIYWVWQNGGDVISPDGKTATGYLDSPATIEAITFLRDLVTKYHVAPEPSTLDQMTKQFGFLSNFLKGDVAIFPRGHWELVGLRLDKEYKPERLAVVGNPSKVKDATVIYESGWVINNAVKKDPAKLLAACQFVEQTTAADYQDTKNITGIAIAANQASADKAAKSTQYPDIEKVFVTETANGRPPYGALYAKWPTVEKALDSLMENVLAGSDIKKEVAASVEEINRELGK